MGGIADKQRALNQSWNNTETVSFPEQDFNDSPSVLEFINQVPLSGVILTTNDRSDTAATHSSMSGVCYKLASGNRQVNNGKRLCGA